MYLVLRGTSFVTSLQLFGGARFLHQPADRFLAMGIIPNDLTSPPQSATATAMVSAWTSKPTNFILLIGPVPFGQQKIFIDKSADGGTTWGTDVAVASTNIGFGTYIPCNGKTTKSSGRVVSPAPQMAIEPSGNIYVVFDGNAGKGKTIDLDVFITKSSNGGRSWSRPQRVSSASTGQQYLPAISIDSSGGVNVTYLDRRDDPNDCRTNNYFSHSTDGGATFTDSKVTSVDSDFDGNPNGPGDYQGEAAWGAGAVAFFSDHRDANATNDNTTGFISGGFEIYAGRNP